MITGVGVDVLRYERIRAEVLTEDDAFVRKVFTDAETETAQGRADRQQYFAGLFASKEAIFKSLRLHPDEVRFSEIEITRTENGAPEATFSGSLGKYICEQGLQVHLSVSYESDLVTAFAVCEQNS